MNLKTLLLAHLAKSQEGNARQTDGDTSITVPNSFLNTISIPDIFTFFSSVPNAGIERHSFIQTDSRFVNANATATLCTLGPGLWEVSFAHWIAPEGAVNDLTALARLQISLIDGTNPLVDLTRFNNTGLGMFQNLSGSFKALLSAEQNLSFIINTTVGAGTGTNRSNVRIIGSKLV